MKIEKIIKVGESSYAINDILLIKIKEDSTLDITYDEKDLTLEEVQDLIEQFLDPV